jgi:hypothetical protein
VLNKAIPTRTAKERYQANTEKVIEKAKKSYQVNKEKISQKYSVNRVKVLEQQKKYDEANRDRILTRLKKKRRQWKITVSSFLSLRISRLFDIVQFQFGEQKKSHVLSFKM